MSQDIQFVLATGPVWLRTRPVIDLLGVKRQSIKQLMDRGVLRCMHNPDQRLLIFRDDVLYVHQQKQKAKTDGSLRASYETLIERGVLSEDAKGADGLALTLWASKHQEGALRSTLFLPPTLVQPESEDAEVKPITIQGLAKRIHRNEQVLQTVLAGQGVHPRLSRLSSSDIHSILRATKEGLKSQRMSATDITKLCKLYLRLDAQSITSIKHFPAEYPDLALDVISSGEVAYRCLFLVGKHLVVQAKSLPGSHLTGSLNARALGLARQTQRLLDKLCTGQAGVDFLLLQDMGKYLPVPMTEIDRFVLQQYGRSR